MRIPRSAAALLGGVALACAVAPVQAQRAFPTLRVGQSLQGRLAEADPAFYEGGHFKVYQFRAQAGMRYVATLESPDFDSYLTLARAVGGITDEMMSDDDGGGEGLASRLRFEVPETGTYLLIAQALGENETGTFTVALDTASVRGATAVDVSIGEPVDGSLTDDDAEYEGLEDVEGYYDLYRFEGRAGQRLRFSMEFGDYVPTLTLGRMIDGEFATIEEDAGNGVLIWTAPDNGEYYLRAGAMGGVTGDYTLSLQERRAVPGPRPSPIRRGQSISGTLESGDGELDDGRWYDAYAYTGRAGEGLHITLSSADFDTYVIIGRMVDGRFEALDFNDDGGEEGGTDSVLELELPDDGRYIIQATSFLDETGGGYELTVSPGN